MECLPQHLVERCRVGKQGITQEGAPVVVWVRKVLRAEENPALDAGILAANMLGTALVVLVHIEDRYRHNTARRQHFLLEGAKEMVEGLGRRGLRAVVHVTRSGHRQPSHLSLACKAALIVAEASFPNHIAPPHMAKVPLTRPLDCRNRFVHRTYPG
jgi:hypothetical protein